MERNGHDPSFEERAQSPVSGPRYARVEILIFEAHEIYRRALAEALQRASYSVSGTAASIEEAHASIAQNTPDVIVLAEHKPVDLANIPALRQASPTSGVCVISTHEDGSSVGTALRAGAIGFVPITACESELIEIVAKVAAGTPSIHDSVVSQALLRAIHDAPIGSFGRSDHTLEVLTPREREVFDLLASGMSPSHIATTLFLSRRTVEGHLTNVYRKFGVHSCVEALSRVQLDPRRRLDPDAPVEERH